MAKVIKGVFLGFDRTAIYQHFADFINEEIKYYYHSSEELASEAEISERTLRKVRKANYNVKMANYFAVIEVLAIAHGYCKEDLAKKLGIDKEMKKFFK